MRKSKHVSPAVCHRLPASFIAALLEAVAANRRALEMANELKPDVVLLDIGLPKLDGYEVAKRIRLEPWGNSAILIAITGWGQAEDKALSREAGFDHHLVKPVESSVWPFLLDVEGPEN